MRLRLLSDLAVIGYEIFLEGDNVRYRYRKSGKPPDTVRPLIDELRRCKAEVINILKTDNTITPPVIDEPGVPVGVIWVNPYKLGTPEARQECLLQTMTAIWEPTFDSTVAIWPRGFISTQEIIKSEQEVERVQSLILSGKANLADFRQAVNAWEMIVEQEVKS